jgi:exodeoxyribonuclease V alpha subunit
MQEYSRLYEQTHDVNQIEVIVPMKVRGDACTYKLNNAIQYLVNPPQKNKPSIPSFVAGQQCELRLGDKVINTQNNYRTMNTENKIQPIFNGQMGTVVAIEDGLPIVDFGKSVGLIVIPRDHLRAIELGYCITTHKSQGSQFDHVIVGIDFTAYALLSREMLYTAITRAKKTCTLVAQNNALRYATGNERISQKKTHLIQCLHDVAHPKLIF